MKLFAFLLIITLSACTPRGVQKEISTEPWTGSPEQEAQPRYRPVVGTRGMVVADDRMAATWGVEILRQGGNAIDAAVATAFAMAVTRPHYASLGGGGFLVYCPRPIQHHPQPCHTIDYREKAPGRAFREMYLRNGKTQGELSLNGALASGVPGVPAGLLLALKKWGTQSRQKLLTRPMELAEKGFLWTGHLEYAAQDRWNAMNAEAQKIFSCGTPRETSLRPCQPGQRLRQPDLAKVLREIARKGTRGFYQGWVAQKIIRGLQQAGGIMTQEDLAHYQARERTPLVGSFRGMEIVTMPPPSAGGAALLQMLYYAEHAGAFQRGFGSVSSIHALAHAMALAFSDRAVYFGDPDFVQIPLQKLLNPKYLSQRWATYQPHTKSLLQDVEPLHEGTNTTHFSVIDREGNAVAITTTVNNNFGSAFVPPGTGVVMNDEMDDFSIHPGTPNLFGLVGTEANSIAPQKRPLSSMTPTIVRNQEGEVQLVLGAQGGPRITTSVFLVLINRHQFGMALTDAVASPRIHHQWKPPELLLESYGFPTETWDALKTMGYSVKEMKTSGKIHALERFHHGRVWGVPDPRAEGAAVPE